MIRIVHERLIRSWDGSIRVASPPEMLDVFKVIEKFERMEGPGVIRKQLLDAQAVRHTSDSFKL